MPAQAAPGLAAATEQKSQPSAELSHSTQGVPAQLSPDIGCLSLDAIVPLLPSDSAHTSPVAFDSALSSHGGLANKRHSGCHPVTAAKARSVTVDDCPSVGPPTTVLIACQFRSVRAVLHVMGGPATTTGATPMWSLRYGLQSGCLQHL